MMIGRPFEFERYINGQLMAEGVTVEREKNLEDACVVAARIAGRGPNGEVPVLVLKSATPASAVWEMRDRCIRELETSYPGHAWLNAACAAIRQIKV